MADDDPQQFDVLFNANNGKMKKEMNMNVKGSGRPRFTVDNVPYSMLNLNNDVIGSWDRATIGTETNEIIIIAV
jgi:hypothetical protein